VQVLNGAWVRSLFSAQKNIRVKTGSGGYSGGIRAHTLALSMEKNKKMYRKELDNT
jgi:hypothetical protein